MDESPISQKANIDRCRRGYALGGQDYLSDIRAWSLRDDGAKLAEAAQNVAKTFHQRTRLRIALHDSHS